MKLSKVLTDTMRQLFKMGAQKSICLRAADIKIRISPKQAPNGYFRDTNLDTCPNILARYIDILVRINTNME